jgi:hypothetical protein
MLVAKERERQQRHGKREESNRQQKCEAREKEREATEAQQRACEKLTVATGARGARKGVRVDRGVRAAKENEMQRRCGGRKAGWCSSNPANTGCAAVAPDAAAAAAPPPLLRHRCSATAAPPPLLRRRCSAASAPPPLLPPAAAVDAAATH